MKGRTTTGINYNDYEDANDSSNEYDLLKTNLNMKVRNRPLEKINHVHLTLIFSWYFSSASFLFHIT